MFVGARWNMASSSLDSVVTCSTRGLTLSAGAWQSWQELPGSDAHWGDRPPPRSCSLCLAAVLGPATQAINQTWPHSMETNNSCGQGSTWRLLCSWLWGCLGILSGALTAAIVRWLNCRGWVPLGCVFCSRGSSCAILLPLGRCKSQDGLLWCPAAVRRVGLSQHGSDTQGKAGGKGWVLALQTSEPAQGCTWEARSRQRSCSSLLDASACWVLQVGAAQLHAGWACSPLPLVCSAAPEAAAEALHCGCAALKLALPRPSPPVPHNWQ